MARDRCACPRCTIRSLLGPAVVITLGVLFLLHQMRGGVFDFGDTWPFLLIVAGGILLASSLAPATGHLEDSIGPPRPSGGSTPPPNSAQNSFTGQGQ